MIALVAWEGIKLSNSISLSNSRDELDRIAESIDFQELQEHSEMTSLFPTFTSIWQRAKQILSSDISPIIEAIKADWAEYQVAVQKEGLDPFGDQFF